MDKHIPKMKEKRTPEEWDVVARTKKRGIDVDCTKRIVLRTLYMAKIRLRKSRISRILVRKYHVGQMDLRMQNSIIDYIHLLLNLVVPLGSSLLYLLRSSARFRFF